MESELHYQSALLRIQRLLLLLTLSGAAAAAAWKGLPAAAGFAVGAAGSWLSFHLFHKLASALGAPGDKPRARLAVLIGSRYLLFGAAGYVIVRYFGVSLPAVLCGLLVSAAAVLLELLYELIYGT